MLENHVSPLGCEVIARRKSRGDIPLIRLNNLLKLEMSLKPAANAISAMVRFERFSNKSRVQTDIRLLLTCSPTERPVEANSLWTYRAEQRNFCANVRAERSGSLL